MEEKNLMSLFYYAFLFLFLCYIYIVELDVKDEVIPTRLIKLCNIIIINIKLRIYEFLIFLIKCILKKLPLSIIFK